MNALLHQKMLKTDASERLTPLGDTDKQTARVALLSLIAAATVLTVLTANECHSKLVAAHLSESYVPSLIFGVVTWLWWIGIAVVLWWCLNRWSSFMKISPMTVLLHVAGGCTIACLHLLTLQAVVYVERLHWATWGHFYDRLNVVNLYRVGGDFAIYGIVFGLSGLLFAQAQTRRAFMLKLEVERQLSEAQLKALQAQIEPHFLFNTLNAITSLVAQHKNDAAMETLVHLNTILRTTLQRRSPEKVPFTEELQLVESYLAIQKVRFADRIEIVIQTSPEARQGLVPCFLLQPLVENAVRHGIEQKKSGGRIQTKAERIGDRLWMQVRDNGGGLTVPRRDGHGIGLSNIRERLAFFYPGEHQFDVETPPEGGYQVTIQIPFEEAPLCG
jgi:two-component sensor histidine kinase